MMTFFLREVLQLLFRNRLFYQCKYFRLYLTRNQIHILKYPLVKQNVGQKRYEFLAIEYIRLYHKKYKKIYKF